MAARKRTPSAARTFIDAHGNRFEHVGGDEYFVRLKRRPFSQPFVGLPLPGPWPMADGTTRHITYSPFTDWARTGIVKMW
jgi:hypothetical protein